jgi:hypothetical protein
MGRRGPKKKQDVKREPNGRASRQAEDITKRLNGDLDADEREALRAGTEARHRLYKLSPGHLRDTDAGSFVGRLRLGDLITMQQCEAAIQYAKVYHEMQVTMGGPKPSGAINLNATHGMPGAENVNRSIQAMDAWRSALAAVQVKQNQMGGTSNLYAALDYCIIRDANCPHMLDWLRIALDTLAAHFRIGDKHKKAA